MIVKIDNLILDVWEEGFPAWFSLSDGTNAVHFTFKEAPFVRDALANLIKIVEIKEERLK